MAIVEIIGAPMSSPSTDQLIDALRPVQDPELHRSIVDLGMVRDVVIDKLSLIHI
jgi:ATP-binding protein involved in chromosome partitioning